jgi:hypothetical protein
MPKPQESQRKDPAPASVPAEKASIRFSPQGGGALDGIERYKLAK